jgi:hypothetical protein
MSDIWWVFPMLFLVWALLLNIKPPKPGEFDDFELLPLLHTGTIIALIFLAFSFIVGHFV